MTGQSVIEWDRPQGRRHRVGCCICGASTAAFVAVHVRARREDNRSQGRTLANRQRSFCREHADEMAARLLDVLQEAP